MPKKRPLNRSQQMARIKNKDTTPEKCLRKALWGQGLRYRIQWKTPAGTADLAFPGRKVAIFIDGCFWHGCPIHYVKPRSKTSFWAAKLVENVERDCRQTRSLEEQGWLVIRIWEHQVFTELDRVVALILKLLHDHEVDRDINWRVFKVIPIDESTDLERRYLLDLRNSKTLKSTEGKRFTTKWKIPKQLIG